MGIAQRGKKGIWQHFRRVPKQYSKIDRRGVVRTSLGVTDFHQAKLLAAQIELEQNAIWEASSENPNLESAQAYENLRLVMNAKGMTYLPSKEVAQLDLPDLLKRVALAQDANQPVEVEALLGKEPVPQLMLSKLTEEYEVIVQDRLVNKTEDQLRRWRAPRIKAVNNLVKIIGNKALSEITRQQVLEFRSWWWARVQAGEVSANSANKDLTYLSAMFKEVALALGQDWRNPFEGLRFREVEAHRVAFSEDWICERLLAPNALSGLNPEAHAILLTMINTGARPSELIGLQAHHIQLDADIPHIQIRADGRDLKTKYSIRDLPLVGASLEAMQKFPEGFVHYRADLPPLRWSSLKVSKLE